MFERKAKATYSTIQHTKSETRAEIVQWVAESLQPFAIVKDRGFRSLMKTGRPDYYIPSPSTIARDVKAVFARVRSVAATRLEVGLIAGVGRFHNRLSRLNRGNRSAPVVATRLESQLRVDQSWIPLPSQLPRRCPPSSTTFQ